SGRGGPGHPRLLRNGLGGGPRRSGAQRRRQDRLRRLGHQAAAAALLAGDQAVGALRALAASWDASAVLRGPRDRERYVVRLARRACAPVPPPGRERSPVRPPGPRALRCAEESQFLPRISAFAGGGAAQASVGDQPRAAGIASGCTFCAAGVKGATSWVQVAPSVASRSMRYCSIAASAHELGV